MSHDKILLNNSVENNLTGTTIVNNFNQDLFTYNYAMNERIIIPAKKLLILIMQQYKKFTKLQEEFLFKYLKEVLVY